MWGGFIFDFPVFFSLKKSRVLVKGSKGLNWLHAGRTAMIRLSRSCQEGRKGGQGWLAGELVLYKFDAKVTVSFRWGFCKLASSWHVSSCNFYVWV